MEDLSLILWRERELLETLLYKLEIEQLVLASGSTRWLATAAREVEAVLDAIRETELLRAVAADEAAASIGLSANPSLRALAEAVDEPWQSILLDHREAFVAYTREITEIAADEPRAAHRRPAGRAGDVPRARRPAGQLRRTTAVPSSRNGRHRLLDQSI